MVIDKIENYALYTSLNERLKKGLEYLVNTDLEDVEAGKYEIEGENVFAIVQDYSTKKIEDCKLETHNKYIDIQYVAKGVECIGVAILKGQEPTTVNEEKDVIFYNEEVSMIKMDAGMFAIFFPEDMHMPGADYKETTGVRKVVVKVRV